jgi:hypothetical protein
MEKHCQDADYNPGKDWEKDKLEKEASHGKDIPEVGPVVAPEEAEGEDGGADHGD